MTARPTKLIRVDKVFADQLRASAKRFDITVVAVTRRLAVAAIRRARRRRAAETAAARDV